LKTVLKRTYTIVLVFLGLNLALQAEEPPSTPQEARQFVNLKARYRFRPNDSPSSLSFFPLPSISYSNYKLWQPKLSVHAMSAGIYNRLNLHYELTSDYFLRSSGSALFFFGGDSPRIDGNEFNGGHEFSGHRYDLIIGFGRNFSIAGLPLSGLLGYQLLSHQFYDYPSTNSFIPPGQFIDHGGHLDISSRSKVFSEIKELGFRPRISTDFFKRENSKFWGASSNIRNVKYYFDLEVESRLAVPVSSRIVLVSNTQGGYVSDADRINAIGDGSKLNKGMGMFLENIKADRTISEDFGLRYYPEATKRVALKPYSFMTTYRELTPKHTRNNWGLGGGLKLMGSSFKDTLAWEFNYGVISHIDRSRALLHEVSALLNLRLFP